MDIRNSTDNINQVPPDQQHPPQVEGQQPGDNASVKVVSQHLQAGRSVSIPEGMTRKQFKEMYKGRLQGTYQENVKVNLNFGQRLIDRVTHFYTHKAYKENVDRLKSDYLQGTEGEFSGYAKAQEHFKAHRVLYESKSHQVINVNSALDISQKTSEKMADLAKAGNTFMDFVRSWAIVLRSFSGSFTTVATTGADAVQAGSAAIDIASLGTAGLLGLAFLPLHFFTITTSVQNFFDTKEKRDAADNFVQTLKKESPDLDQSVLDACDAGRMLRNQYDLWDAGLDNIDEVQSMIASLAATTCAAVGAVATGSVVGVEVGAVAFAAGATVSVASLGTTIGFGMVKKGRKMFKSYQKKKWNEAGQDNPKLKEKAGKKAEAELKNRIKGELEKAQLGHGGKKVKITKEDVKAVFAREDYQKQLKSLEDIIFNEDRSALPKYKEARRKAEKEIMAQIRADKPTISPQEMNHKINNMQKEISDRTEMIIHSNRLRRDLDYMVSSVYENVVKEQDDYLENKTDAVDMDKPSARFLNYFIGGANNLTGHEHVKILADSPDEAVAKAYLKKMIKLSRQ